MKNIVFIKIVNIDNQIRKLKITKLTTFDELRSKSIEFFGKNDEKYHNILFNYNDQDGDTITFSTEEEWTSLLESVKENEVMKIKVVFNEKNEKEIEKRGDWKERRGEWKERRGEWKERRGELKQKREVELKMLKETKQFEKQVNHLQSMGYFNEMQNYRLLQKFDGNVERVLERLVQKNEKFQSRRRFFDKSDSNVVVEKSGLNVVGKSDENVIEKSDSNLYEKK